MTQTPRRFLAALFALALLLCVPASASAEYLVPEGNSAVNQYTEGLPSAGGEKSTKGDEKKPVTPAKTIGAGNAKKLESQGPEGREVAEVAAETAPTSDPAGSDETGKAPAAKKQHAKQQPHDEQKSGATKETAVTPTPTGGGSDGSSGSSGAGAVLAAATGTESGDLGLLLPLLIVAAVACGVGYSWHQRKHPAPR